MNERLLTTKEVSEMVRFGPTKIREWVIEGRFPPPIRPNGQARNRWLESEVSAWIRDQADQNRTA